MIYDFRVHDFRLVLQKIRTAYGFLSSVARSVFNNSEAMVIGPTPPGTGVMNDVFGATAFKINITLQGKTIFVLRALHTGSAHINYYSTFFYHISCNDARLAYRNNSISACLVKLAISFVYL
jgi:hypothetical protein